jgi:hypothetical protein
VEHACASRHGDAPAAGIAASRRSRRYPKRLRLCMRGLRWPAASCLAGPALQPQMLAAWRRPSRGAPTGPRCPGRMCSGRPYEAADTCCGRARAQRPSGEHGFRGVARVFSLRGERGEKSFFMPLAFVYSTPKCQNKSFEPTPLLTDSSRSEQHTRASTASGISALDSSIISFCWVFPSLRRTNGVRSIWRLCRSMLSIR